MESLAFLIFVLCILYVVIWSVKAERGIKREEDKFSLKKPGQGERAGDVGEKSFE